MTKILNPTAMTFGRVKNKYSRKTADISIAVVIVGRNPGGFLTEMLESLYLQTEQPDEIVYYDDCSDDDSLSILNQWKAKMNNLRVISGKRPVGISAARNIANRQVNSKYIAVLDSDDLFLPDTVAEYRKALQADPDIDLLYADTFVFREGSLRRRRMRYPDFMESPASTWRLMTSPVVPFKHSSIIYRKEVVEELGGYREDLPLKVDFDLFLRFLNTNAVVKKLDAATSRHRSHRNQVSKRRIHGIALYWKIIDTYESRALHSVAFKALRAIGEMAKFVLGR